MKNEHKVYNFIISVMFMILVVVIVAIVFSPMLPVVTIIEWEKLLSSTSNPLLFRLVFLAVLLLAISLTAVIVDSQCKKVQEDHYKDMREKYDSQVARLKKRIYELEDERKKYL